MQTLIQTTTPKAPALQCTCHWAQTPDCPAHGVHENARRFNSYRSRAYNIVCCAEPLCRGSYLNDDHPQSLCPGCRD